MLEQNIKQLEEVITKRLRLSNETDSAEVMQWNKNYIWGMELVLIAAGYKVTYYDENAYIEKF